MADVRELFRRACDQFGEKVAGIREEQWGDQTPCSEWDVRALVEHLVSENAWISPLLAGRSIADVGDSLSGDLLGHDPKGAWRDHAAQALAAVNDEAAMDRTVQISRGEVPGAEYVFEVVADLAVHGWDLARAIGADETMDPELLDVVYPYYEPLVALLKPTGAYGPDVDVPPGADRQTTLLAMLGRKAW
jgi:uncharacterized protein (TIGR03086 family)